MGVDADPGPRPGPGRRRMARKRRKRYHPPGTQPGTLVAHAEAQGTPVRVRAFRYDAGRCEERDVPPSALSSLSTPESGVLWIDVEGVSDPAVVRVIGERVGVHTPALEGGLNVPPPPTARG